MSHIARHPWKQCLISMDPCSNNYNPVSVLCRIKYSNGQPCIEFNNYSVINIIDHYHQVSASQSLVSTRIGSNVSLSCNYNLGSINATVYWMFRGSPLDPNDTRFIISTTSNRSASLVLRRVIREDSTGRFACVIQSDHGFGVAEIVLTIDRKLICNTIMIRILENPVSRAIRKQLSVA